MTPRTWLALLTGAVFCVASGFAQTLSVVKTPDRKYQIEGSAPAAEPHQLETSANLRLWVSVGGEVRGSFTYPLETQAASHRYYRLVPAVAAEPIRVLLVGDSMSADCCGWGPGLPRFFKENVTFVNYAAAWFSTGLFMQSAEWEKMLLIQPQYVLIQFGWIDGSADPDRGITPEAFGTNLRTIVDAVRGFNGVPILITLHAPRLFDSQGQLKSILPQDYNNAAKRVAAESNSPMIDLYRQSFDLFNRLGPSGCEFMLFNPTTPDDVMHVSPVGAGWVAQLVAQGLPEALGPYLADIFEPQPTR